MNRKVTDMDTRTARSRFRLSVCKKLSRMTAVLPIMSTSTNNLTSTDRVLGTPVLGGSRYGVLC